MYLQKIGSYSFVTALLISGCVPLPGASVTVINDRTTWQNAVSNLNNIGFEGIATLGGGPVKYDGSGVILGSVTFQGFDTASTTPDLEINFPNISWTGAFLEGPAGNSGGQHIVATLPTGIFAVGSDIMLYDGNAGTSLGQAVTVQLSVGPTMYNTQTISGFTNRDFIGFVSDTPISSVTFFPSSDPGPHLVIDNFSTGGQAVSPTPEAATLLMCGGGLIFMAWLFRRNTNSNGEPHRCA